jgi:hypothetical protein
MTANNFSSRTPGWLALAVGVVALVGVVSLILFFTFSSLFGTLNDLCIAIEAIFLRHYGLVLSRSHELLWLCPGRLVAIGFELPCSANG